MFVRRHTECRFSVNFNLAIKFDDTFFVIVICLQ